MSNGHTWLGVLAHLACLQDNSGSNGLATWGIDDRLPFDMPFINPRKVEFEYGADGNQGSTGGNAWEGELPGPVLGLPPPVSIKVIAQEGLPDVSLLFAVTAELKLDKLFGAIAANIMTCDAVMKALGKHWSRMFPFLVKLEQNFPHFEFVGMLGVSLGMAMDTMTPYVRLLTSYELNLEIGALYSMLGPLGETAARQVSNSTGTSVHSLDASLGNLGGRSWQISSFANIPTRMS
ncbi:MAG: hypothetical protein AAGF11_22035 [Myxococcota bacterium]